MAHPYDPYVPTDDDKEYMKSLMISQSPAALDALRKGKAPGLSSQQIRSLIKPFTKPDQFGHPTGSLRV